MTTASVTREVLVISGDTAITQSIQRVVAAAGLTPEVCKPADATARWNEPSAVLVGVDALEALVREDPMRRDGVYVVAATEIPDEAWRNCVALGACDVVNLTEAEGWLVERLALDEQNTRGGLTIRVFGATGGCGASVTSAALALAADGAAVLMDTDLRSGWLDLLLGIDADGLGWAELANLKGRVSGDALTASIPTRDEISLIATNRDAPLAEVPADALRSAVLAASGLGSLVVIDDHVSAGERTVAEQLADVTVLVTTSDLRGGLAARAEIDMLRPASPDEPRQRVRHPLLVAARTTRGAALPTATFTELTSAADDVLWLREAPGIARRVTRGQPGLNPRDRLVRDCVALLERCTELAATR